MPEKGLVGNLLRIRCEYCRTRMCMDRRATSSSPVCYGDCALTEEPDEPVIENPAAGEHEILVAALSDYDD